MQLIKPLQIWAIASFTAIFAISPLSAASPFSKALSVNGTLITHYDIDQRAAILDIVNDPINPEEAMIEDVLKRNAAAQSGIKVPRDRLDGAVDSFLSQSNLPRDEAIAALGNSGVALRSLERFVETNLLWRDYAQQRFAGQVAQFRQDQSAVALAPRGYIEVNVSEIILPLIPGEEEDTRFFMQELRLENSAGAFAENARQYSASPSRPDGGRIGWLRFDTTNPVLRGALEKINVGEVTDVIEIPGGMAIFRLNGERENTPPPRPVLQYGYLVIKSAAPAALDTAIAKMQRCDDIYRYVHEIEGLSYGFSDLPPGQVPADISRHLPALDAYEVMRLSPQSAVMLCSRVYDAPVADAEGEATLGTGAGLGISDDVLLVLDRRLNALAQGHLAQLKSKAVIKK